MTTGVITQPYRLPGTPNFPDAKKRLRAAVVMAPTKLLAVTNKLWTPGEIEAAFSTDAAQVAKPAGSSKTNGRHPTTPRSSAAVKRRLSRKANPEMDRSAQFQSAVNAAVRAGVSPNDLEAEMRKHPDGCASKYLESGDRLRAEINRHMPRLNSNNSKSRHSAMPNMRNVPPPAKVSMAPSCWTRFMSFSAGSLPIHQRQRALHTFVACAHVDDAMLGNDTAVGVPVARAGQRQDELPGNFRIASAEPDPGRECHRPRIWSAR